MIITKKYIWLFLNKEHADFFRTISEKNKGVK